MEGGCLCGAVRYVIAGSPTSSGVCHCMTCRRVASALSLPFIGVSTAQFRFTKGVPADFSSSPGITRCFCGRCGSPLTYRVKDHPDELDVMTGSLDDPEAVPPSFHVWVSEAVSWDSLSDGLPKYPRSRQG